jgi:hypothetical protein
MENTASGETVEVRIAEVNGAQEHAQLQSQKQEPARLSYL